MRQPQTILSVPYPFLTQSEVPEIIFENAVAEAIDDVFSVLGIENKQAIYRQLKNNCGINENEIAYKIEDFARAIDQIFGSGAKLIEIKIMELLHAKFEDLSYIPKKGELNFVEFVYNLQRHLQSGT